MFNAPSAGGEVLKPEDLIGHLLIVRPLSHETGIQTTFGEKDGIRVDVAVLTQTNPDGSYGVVAHDVLWLQGKLVGALKRQIGELVLARMGLGTGKPGQKAPYELQDATGDPQAVAFAEQWMGQHPDFVTALKAPTQAAPQPAPVPAAAPIPGAAPVPQAAPAPAAVPAAVPTAAPVPATPAVPAAAPAGIDPAVLAQLSPDALKQLAAMAAQQTA